VLSVLVVAASVAWIIGTLLEFAFPDLPGVVTAKLAVEAVVEFWLVAYCSSRA
jgi:predicted outer membrane lipoprotein